MNRIFVGILVVSLSLFIVSSCRAGEYEMGDTVQVGVEIVVNEVLSWEAYCLSDPIPQDCIVIEVGDLTADDLAIVPPDEQRQQLTEWRGQ